MSKPIDPALLLKAYAAGIFPMADGRDATDVYWVDPRKRGVLPLDGFRLSRSLAKTLKSEKFETTVDRAFNDVVKSCAEMASDRPATWINHQIEASVSRLHSAGHAHSVETWVDGSLVGGLYGVRLGRAFFGESMFSRAKDASKVALAHLVARLRVGDFALLDCQFITPHLASLGAKEIDRTDYMVLLSSALSTLGSGSDSSPSPDFFAFDALDSAPPPRTTKVFGPISGWRIAQALGHTS